MANRADQIQDVLKELMSTSSDIEGAALVTVDGLPMASALAYGADEDRISAMGAAMLSMGERTVSELKRGTLEQVYVKGNGGYVVLMQAGPEALLETISGSGARLGLVLLEMKRAAAELSKLV
jgi:predicted regulator of Ras-like GTPase activity (Roadblock/LC7/MglB family)